MKRADLGRSAGGGMSYRKRKSGIIEGSQEQIPRFMQNTLFLNISVQLSDVEVVGIEEANWVPKVIFKQHPDFFPRIRISLHFDRHDSNMATVFMICAEGKRNTGQDPVHRNWNETEHMEAGKEGKLWRYRKSSRRNMKNMPRAAKDVWFMRPRGLCIKPCGGAFTKEKSWWQPFQPVILKMNNIRCSGLST